MVSRRAAPRRTRNPLRKKLLRDMRASVMQFFALVVLCVLSTFLFSGIDGIARMIRTTNSTYFESGNLADLWVTLPEMDRASLARLRGIDGVQSVQARFSLDMQTELPGDGTGLYMGDGGGHRWLLLSHFNTTQTNDAHTSRIILIMR